MIADLESPISAVWRDRAPGSRYGPGLLMATELSVAMSNLAVDSAAWTVSAPQSLVLRRSQRILNRIVYRRAPGVVI